MEKQTFAQLLWLSLPPTLVGSTAIKGFDAWLLRQVHRVKVAPTSAEAVADHYRVCTYQNIESARRNTSLIHPRGERGAERENANVCANLLAPLRPAKVVQAFRVESDDQKQQRFAQHPY